MEASASSADMLDFLFLVGKLKHIKRTGWVLKDIPDPECVAGHMHRMALITFLLNTTNNTINQSKCLQLAVVHDVAECIVGDLTPHCGIDQTEKHRLEDEAMQKLCGLVGGAGSVLYELYKEYEARETPEARFVKELDNLDMILEAFTYEKSHDKPGFLQEFFDSTSGKFSHPLVTSLVQELMKRRDAFSSTRSSLSLNKDT